MPRCGRAPRTGDHDAFGQLFDRHAGAVYSYLFRLTANSSGIGPVAIRVPSGTVYRVTASAQEGSVRVSVPRAAASTHVIQATTSTGTVTVAGS